MYQLVFRVTKYFEYLSKGWPSHVAWRWSGDDWRERQLRDK